jgi:hypothetical protein
MNRNYTFTVDQLISKKQYLDAYFLAHKEINKYEQDILKQKTAHDAFIQAVNGSDLSADETYREYLNIINQQLEYLGILIETNKIKLVRILYYLCKENYRKHEQFALYLKEIQTLTQELHHLNQEEWFDWLWRNLPLQIARAAHSISMNPPTAASTMKIIFDTLKPFDLIRKSRYFKDMCSNIEKIFINTEYMVEYNQWKNK